MASSRDYEDYARFVAEMYGTDPDILVRRIKQESGWQPRATSPAGARGLGQFMPDTGARYGLKSDEDFYDPYKSIEAAAHHQADLDKQFGNDPVLTSIAYNAGPGRVADYKKRGMKALKKETQDYIRILHGPGAKGGGGGGGGAADDFAKYLKDLGDQDAYQQTMKNLSPVIGTMTKVGGMMQRGAKVLQEPPPELATREEAYKQRMGGTAIPGYTPPVRGPKPPPVQLRDLVEARPADLTRIPGYTPPPPRQAAPPPVQPQPSPLEDVMAPRPQDITTLPAAAAPPPETGAVERLTPAELAAMNAPQGRVQPPGLPPLLAQVAPPAPTDITRLQMPPAAQVPPAAQEDAQAYADYLRTLSTIRPQFGQKKAPLPAATPTRITGGLPPQAPSAITGRPEPRPFWEIEGKTPEQWQAEQAAKGRYLADPSHLLGIVSSAVSNAGQMVAGAGRTAQALNLGTMLLGPGGMAMGGPRPLEGVGGKIAEAGAAIKRFAPAAEAFVGGVTGMHPPPIRQDLPAPIFRGLADVTGSSVPFSAATSALAAIGAPGWVVEGASAIMGYFSQMAEAYDDATQNYHLSHDEALRYALLQAPIGLSEAIGIGGGAVPKAFEAGATRTIRQSIRRAAAEAVRHEIGHEFKEEGGQEFFQNLATDFVKQVALDPQHKIDIPAAIGAGLLGGISGGIHAGVGGVAGLAYGEAREGLRQALAKKPELAAAQAPESASAIQAQFEAIGRGERKAVMVRDKSELSKITLDDGKPATKGRLESEGWAVTTVNHPESGEPIGTFVHRYDPRSISEGTGISRQDLTAQARTDEGRADLLGKVEPRPDANAPVVVASQGGHEVDSAQVSPEAIPAQTAEFQKQHPEAGVSVETPEETLAAREQTVAAETSGKGLPPTEAAEIGGTRPPPAKVEVPTTKPVEPEREEDIVNPIDRTAKPEEKVRQLQALSEENKPIVADIMKKIDGALGTQSTANEKLPERILEKAKRPSTLAEKPWHDVEHIRDSYRFKTKLNSLEDLRTIAKTLADSGVQVVKLDTAKLFNPKPWGWRFVGFDLRMPNGQLVEYYATLKEVDDDAKVKDPNHLLFEKWRNKSEEEILSRSDEFKKDVETSRNRYNEAWKAGLQRLGFADEAAARASFNNIEASLSETLSKLSSSSTAPTTPLRQAPPRRTIAKPPSSSTIASPDLGLTKTSAAIEPTSIESIPEKEAQQKRLQAAKEATGLTWRQDSVSIRNKDGVELAGATITPNEVVGKQKYWGIPLVHLGYGEGGRNDFANLLKHLLIGAGTDDARGLYLSHTTAWAEEYLKRIDDEQWPGIEVQRGIVMENGKLREKPPSLIVIKDADAFQKWVDAGSPKIPRQELKFEDFQKVKAGETYPGKFGIVSFPGLTPEARAIEQRDVWELEHDPEGVLRRYAEEFAKKGYLHVNTDNARELWKGFKDDYFNRVKNSDGYLAASTAVAKLVWERALPHAKHVLVVAGGGGSGKGYVIATTDIAKGIDLVLDMTMGKPSGLQRLEDAKNAGVPVRLTIVLTPTERAGYQAFNRGVETGRTGSEAPMALDHYNAPRYFLKAHEDYQGLPGWEFQAIHKLTSKTHEPRDVDFVRGWVENDGGKENVLEEFRKGTDRAAAAALTDAEQGKLRTETGDLIAPETVEDVFAATTPDRDPRTTAAAVRTRRGLEGGEGVREVHGETAESAREHVGGGVGILPTTAPPSRTAPAARTAGQEEVKPAKTFPKEVTDETAFLAKRGEILHKIRQANLADLGEANNAVVRPLQRQLENLENARKEYLAQQEAAEAEPTEAPKAPAPAEDLEAAMRAALQAEAKPPPEKPVKKAKQQLRQARKERREQRAAKAKEANAEERAAAIKALKAKLGKPTLPMGFDPEYVTLTARVLTTYIKDGVTDFRKVIGNLADDFGEGWQNLYEYAATAWRILKETHPNISDTIPLEQYLAEVERERTITPTETVPGPDQGRPEELQGVPGEGRPERVPGPPPGNGPGVRGTTGEGRGERTPGEAGGGAELHDLDPTGTVSRRTTSVTPNFVIHEPDKLGAGGMVAKFRNNVAAIRLLKQIKDEGRFENKQITFEEQQALAKYVGWGAFPGVFNTYRPIGESEDAEAEWDDWADRRQELLDLRDQGLITDEAYETARNSTQFAHYTSGPVVQAMWDMVQRLGFQGGRVLEPAVGTGNFLGLVPSDIREQTAFSAVEMDHTSGEIATLLYPQSDVKIQRFENTDYPDNFFDMVISNFPFSSTTIKSDPRYRGFDPTLHDYFFLKSLDLTKPGGLVVSITSMGTMDKVETKVREKLGRTADLVAAIRLPGGTFAKTAGTDVTTDIVILRKRMFGEPAGDTRWMKTKEVTVPGNKPGVEDGPVTVNEYFVKNPDQIIGTLDRAGTMYGGEEKHVTAPPKGEAQKQLDKLIKKLPENIFSANERPEVKERVVAPGEVKEGGYVFQNGKLHQRQGNELIEIPNKRGKTLERIRGMLKIRDAMNALVDAEKDGAESPELRKALNEAYDSFVYKKGRLRKKVENFGFIHNKVNKDALFPDPDLYLIESLEKIDPETKEVVGKADIFTVPTSNRLTRPLSAPDASSAMGITFNETGRLDMARMAELLGKSEEEVGADLHKEGLAFEDPTQGWQPTDYYLSGNVRQKLVAAKAADLIHPGRYTENVKALEKVQPKDIPHNQIDVRLGAPWVSPEDITEFAATRLGASPQDFVILYNPVTGAWSARYSSQGERNWQYSPAATQIYGTQRRIRGRENVGVNFIEVLESALNQRTMVIKRLVSRDPERWEIDVEESAAAEAKRRKVLDEFKPWLWQDEERRGRLHRFYNDQFNNMRDVQWSGQHLTLPGLNPKFLEPGQLSPHHKDDAWRFITTGRILLAHEVGVGKSFTQTIALMEAKRLGLSNKPMLIVPKANIHQATETAKMLYPGKRILSTAGNFTEKKRKTVIAQIATNNWDLVILSHEHLKMIPVSTAIEHEYIQKQIHELEDAMGASEAVDPTRNNRVVKQLEKKKDALMQRLGEVLHDTKRDDTWTFDKLGVDMLWVDEAHVYKSLPVYTVRDRVKGIPTNDSKRSTDLHMRIEWLYSKNGGKGVGFGTGTPVTNTLVELYNMQKFLQPNILRERGVYPFDAWANTFGETVSKFEYKATGEYEPVERFAKYGNLPELLGMAHDMMSVRFASDMPWIKRPKRKDRVVETEMTARQRRYLQILRYRSRLLKDRDTPPGEGEDNILVVMTDARKMGVDARLVDPLAPDDPTSKTNMVVRDVLEKYHKDKTRTQLIFSDVGVHPTVWGFSVFDDVINKLVKGGIPRKDILNFSDMTEVQKASAADKIFRGEAKIGIGSSTVMGQGLNLQKFLKYSHNLDVPYTPARNEQRDGRIHRQKNTNEEIDIARYVTMKSFDVLMWQMNETKAAFIKDAMRGGMLQREFVDEDNEVLTPAQIFAVASGNPHLIKKLELDHEIAALQEDRLRHESEHAELELAKDRTHANLLNAKRRIGYLEGDRKQAAKTAGDKFKMTFVGVDAKMHTYETKLAATEALNAYQLQMSKAYENMLNDKKQRSFEFHRGELGIAAYTTGLGEYRGFEFKAGRYGLTLQGSDSYDANYSVASLDSVLSDHHFKQRIEKAEKEAQVIETNIAAVEEQLKVPFPGAERLAAAKKELAEVSDLALEAAEAQARENVQEVVEPGKNFMLGTPDKPFPQFVNERMARVADAYEQSDDEDYRETLGVLKNAKAENEARERTKEEFLNAYLRDNEGGLYDRYKEEEGGGLLWTLQKIPRTGLVTAINNVTKKARFWKSITAFEEETGHIIYAKYDGPKITDKTVDGIVYSEGVTPITSYKPRGKPDAGGPLITTTIDGVPFISDGTVWMLKGEPHEGEQVRDGEISPDRAKVVFSRGEGGDAVHPIGAYGKGDYRTIWFSNGKAIFASQYNYILSRFPRASWEFVDTEGSDGSVGTFSILKGDERVGIIGSLRGSKEGDLGYPPPLVMSVLDQMAAQRRALEGPRPGLRPKEYFETPATEIKHVPSPIERVRQQVREATRGRIAAGEVGAITIPARTPGTAATSTANGPPAAYRGFSDPAVEERWQKAKGIQRGSLMERVRESVDKLKRIATRDFEHLPRVYRHAKFRAALHNLEFGKGIASDEAIRLLHGLTVKMDAETYDLFTRRVILNDLMEEAERQRTIQDPTEPVRIPFGLTPESLANESAALDQHLRDPRFKDMRDEIDHAVKLREDVLKQVTDAYLKAADDAIGFEPEMNRKHYFRHQVLEYANGMQGQLRGTGERIQAPTGRGFLRRRRGSELDINTSYLQAEHSVLAQMMYDTQVFNLLKLVDSEYNISGKLKADAKMQNRQAIDAKVYVEQKAANKDMDDPPAGRVGKQMAAFRSAKGRGFSELRDMVDEGTIWTGDNNEWEKAASNLASTGNTTALNEDNQLFQYLSALAVAEGENGNLQARAILKAISDQRTFVKAELGDKFKTWEGLLPTNHVLWQPRQGNVFYNVYTLPEKLITQAMEDVNNTIGFKAGDLRRAMAMGQKRTQFAVPQEVAETLNHFLKMPDSNILDNAVKQVVKLWKVTALISPQRVFKYNVRNLSGDGEALAVGNPKAFLKVGKSIKDLWSYLHDKNAPSPELQEWIEHGGLYNLFQVAEDVGSINGLAMFRNLKVDKDGNLKSLNLWKQYWRAARIGTDFREAILRYAAYLDYRTRDVSDTDYGASIPEEVDAITDPADRAWKLSNDLMGAYNEVTVAGKWLRTHLFPFWSWQEVNTKRYYRLFKNAVHSSNSTVDAGYSVLGRAARATPFVAYRVGKFALKATGLWIALTLFNNLVFPDEEKDLDEKTRSRMHIILGRKADGSVIYFDRLGMLGDFLSWFGLDEAPHYVQDFLNNKRTLKEIGVDMAQSPVNKVWQATGLPKTAAEVAFGRTTYPDLFRSRNIRDRWEFLFSSFGLRDEYNMLAGKPTRGIGHTIRGAFVYEVEPGESAYNDILSLKADYQRKHGKPVDMGSGSDKANAAYYTKLALRYGDLEAAKNMLLEFKALGGTADGLKESIKNMGPLAGLNEKEKKDFLKTLTPDEQARLQKAQAFYEQIAAESKQQAFTDILYERTDLMRQFRDLAFPDALKMYQGATREQKKELEPVWRRKLESAKQYSPEQVPAQYR